MRSPGTRPSALLSPGAGAGAAAILGSSARATSLCAVRSTGSNTKRTDTILPLMAAFTLNAILLWNCKSFESLDSLGTQSISEVCLPRLRGSFLGIAQHKEHEQGEIARLWASVAKEANVAEFAETRAGNLKRSIPGVKYACYLEEQVAGKALHALFRSAKGSNFDPRRRAVQTDEPVCSKQD
ncbi:hypothetical protein R1sor_013482 [Riccia sorocarpa]|uniref:Uncharacterized protein n=1 Tax=Riccia sorocarpa TaxID=122646 RepID=A0ABD3H7A0_9MARC